MTASAALSERNRRRGGQSASPTPPPRSRPPYGEPMRTTGARSPPGAPPTRVSRPASPATVAAFLAAEADREFRPVTIARRTAAIAAAHCAQDHPNPCDSGAVAAVLSGIRPARHRTDAPRGAARPQSPRPAARADRHYNPLRAARPRAPAARLRRRPQALGARRARRRGPRVRPRPRTARHDPQRKTEQRRPRFARPMLSIRKRPFDPADRRTSFTSGYSTVPCPRSPAAGRARRGSTTC